LPWRSTHICRHTFATISLVATRDLGNVQALLGHTKQEMTQKYAKVVAMLDSGSADKTASLFALSENHAINHANSNEQIKNPLLLQGV
jgi:integrase